MNVRNPGKKPVDKNYGKFLLEFVLHEDKIFTSRINLFLVTESLLFVAYIGLLSHIELKIILIIMSFSSVFITLMYIIVFYYNVEILNRLKEETQEYYPYYKELKTFYPRHNTNFLLGRILPIAIFIVWILLVEYILI